MLRLSTGFGTSQQKDENIILRLTGQGVVVEVRTFEVGSKPWDLAGIFQIQPLFINSLYGGVKDESNI